MYEDFDVYQCDECLADFTHKEAATQEGYICPECGSALVSLVVEDGFDVYDLDEDEIDYGEDDEDEDEFGDFEDTEDDDDVY